MKMLREMVGKEIPRKILCDYLMKSINDCEDRLERIRNLGWEGCEAWNQIEGEKIAFQKVLLDFFDGEDDEDGSV